MPVRSRALALAAALATSACAAAGPGSGPAPGAAAGPQPAAGTWYERTRRLGTAVHLGEVPPAAGGWMSGPDEPEPRPDEHQAFYDGLDDRLDALLKAEGLHAPGQGSAAYVRGDFFGWREEELYAYGERFAGRPEALARVVRLVQAYLREHPRWRVTFPLGEGPEVAIAIYPGRIFHGPRELDEAGLAEVTGRYVAERTREQEEEVAARRSLLDAVGPALAQAVRRAREEGTPQLVGRLRRHDAVLVWTVDPRGARDEEVPGLRLEPNAVALEEFRLDASGEEVAEDAPRSGAAARLLVWALGDPQVLRVRVTRGLWSATWELEP